MIQSTREFSRQRLTDRRDVPAYTYAQAAMALRLPVSTLRAWTHGQNYTTPRGERKRFEPLISLPPYEYEPGLSYNNLIEAFALRALRTRHHIDMRQVRMALRIAEEKYGIKRLLIHKDLMAAPGEMFLDNLGALVNLTPSHQLAMALMLERYLQRVAYDAEGLAKRFYPLTRGLDSPQIVAMAPEVAFGRPVIARLGIRTAAIVARIDAGEDPDFVRDDYGLRPEELEEALIFEQAAA